MRIFIISDSIYLYFNCIIHTRTSWSITPFLCLNPHTFTSRRRFLDIIFNGDFFRRTLFLFSLYICFFLSCLTKPSDLTEREEPTSPNVRACGVLDGWIGDEALRPTNLFVWS